MRENLEMLGLFNPVLTNFLGNIYHVHRGYLDQITGRKAVLGSGNDEKYNICRIYDDSTLNIKDCKGMIFSKQIWPSMNTIILK